MNMNEALVIIILAFLVVEFLPHLVFTKTMIFINIDFRMYNEKAI